MIGWQTVYDNNPRKVYLSSSDASKEKVQNIIGGEACLWTETADGLAIEAKLWPRGSALAERLWSDPDSSWKEAETRFIHHRQRIVSRGILADAVQPEWCHQNEKRCRNWNS